MLYRLARSALFKLDPEVAHDLTLKSLAALGPGAALLGAGADATETRKVVGLAFPHPVVRAAAPAKHRDYPHPPASPRFELPGIVNGPRCPNPGDHDPRAHPRS